MVIGTSIDLTVRCDLSLRGVNLVASEARRSFSSSDCFAYYIHVGRSVCRQVDHEARAVTGIRLYSHNTARPTYPAHEQSVVADEGPDVPRNVARPKPSDDHVLHPRLVCAQPEVLLAAEIQDQPHPGQRSPRDLNGLRLPRHKRIQNLTDGTGQPRDIVHTEGNVPRNEARTPRRHPNCRLHELTLPPARAGMVLPKSFGILTSRSAIPSLRQLSDESLVGLIYEVHEGNHGLYGARKV